MSARCPVCPKADIAGHALICRPPLSALIGRATTAQRPSCRHQCVLCVCGVSLACLLRVSQVQRVPRVPRFYHRDSETGVTVMRLVDCDPDYDREHGDTGSSNARSRAPPLASPWYAGCRPLARNREPPAYDGHAPISRVALQQDWAYSITSSARASSIGGTVRPSALAVIRLMTRSNLVGCSTGMSAGFVPRRILSTKLAVCCQRSGKFGP